MSTPFCAVALPDYIPTKRARWFPFLHILAHTCYPSVTATLAGMTWYHSVIFIFISLMVTDEIFSCMHWTFIYLLWENVCSGHLPIFYSNYYFCYWIIWDPYIFLIFMSARWLPNIFSQSLGCTFYFVYCTASLAV